MTCDPREELAGLAPAPTWRDLPPGRHQILKEHLMSEIRIANVPAQTRPHRHTRRKIALSVAAAGLAAAVSVTIMKAGSPAAPPATAAQLLAKIANAAAHQPTPVVRDNQYEFIQTEALPRYFQTGGIPVGGSARASWGKPYETQLWRPVANSCEPMMERSGPPDAGTSKSLASTGPCPDKGSLNTPTYRFLQSLPLNPRALINLIYAEEKGHGPAPDDEAFVTIGDLIDSSVVPPQVSAALYRAAALIPGVTIVPDVTLLGDHGVAVTYVYQHFTTQWVFDKTSLQYMGERGVNQHNTLTNEVLVERTGFVDHLGQLP